MAAHFQPLLTRPSLVAGAAGCVLLIAWTRHLPRPEDIRAAATMMAQRGKSLGRCGMIATVHPDAALPDDNIRDILQTEVRKLDPYVVCGATVISRGGLAGAALRALVSTLQLLTRTKRPEKIVSTAAQAVSFVHGELSRRGVDAPPIEALTRAYEELTAAAWAA